MKICLVIWLKTMMLLLIDSFGLKSFQSNVGCITLIVLFCHVNNLL